MKDFRRPSGQGAGRTGGFAKREQSSDFRAPRPSGDTRGGYNKYSASRDSGERREVKHKAQCSDCGNTCEVPFRPNGSKPVYCKECFGKKKGAYPSNNPANNAAPRAATHQNHSSASVVQTEVRDARIDELKAQVFSMQSKLDRIIRTLESAKAAEATPVETKVSAPVVAKTAVKKAPAVKKSISAAKKPISKTTAKAKPAAKKKK